MRRFALPIAIAASMLGLAGAVAASGQAPVIRKPQPVGPGVGTMPALPPAEIDDQLAIGGEDIKGRKVETRMTVEVRVNGRGPYRFVVDSGADSSVVGLRIARDLQLPLGRPAILNAMTGRNLVDRVKVAELSFGPSTIRNLEVPALREYDLGGEGMIGIDALVRQRLMMDFEKRLVKVEDARTPFKPHKDDIVIIAHRRRGQLILTQVRAAGLGLEAVIDTGTQVTIGNFALRDKLLRHNRDKIGTVKVAGVTGETAELQIARIAELQLGPVVLRDVPIAFADVPPFALFGLANEPALLLGTDILENFRRVSLDFRARRVRFQLRKCTPEGIMLHTGPVELSTRLAWIGDKEACAR